jgi:hypothetical protein
MTKLEVEFKSLSHIGRTEVNAWLVADWTLLELIEQAINDPFVVSIKVDGKFVISSTISQ